MIIRVKHVSFRSTQSLQIINEMKTYLLHPVAMHGCKSLFCYSFVNKKSLSLTKL